MKQLRSETVAVEKLPAELQERMLSLMRRCYEGVVPERFRADLAAKQYVILLFDKADDSLAGFSTIGLQQVEHGGRRIEVLFSGDTVIHPDYWGQKVLDGAFSRFLFWRKIRRPFQPLRWLLLSGGYKTYLIILRYFAGAFPRRGLTPPAEEVAFVDALCRRWWPEQYDPAAGIVRMQGHYKVKAGIAPVDSSALADPDIRFFVERNPGHVDGDELVCIADVRLGELFRAFARIIGKRLGLVSRSRSADARGVRA